METRPVKIAILSCNHGHAKSYYGLAKEKMFDLVGVSMGQDAERLDLLDPKVPRYKSDEELYEAHPELEAVVIASDNKSHIAQVREAVRRGLHIYSMKVPTFSPEEYREMIELTEKAGIVFQIELELRNYGSVHRVQEMIAEGELGELLSLNMINYSHNPVWWRPWQCNPEKSFGERVELRPGDERFRGGALADHPHVFDLARYFTGSSFDTVYAEPQPNIRDGVETEDMVRIIGRMKNGTIVSIDPSYANNEHHVKVQVDWWKYPQVVEVFMSAVGTKGTLVADIYGKHSYNQGGVNGTYICGMPTNITMWSIMTQEFYECVRYGKKPTINLRWHYETIAAMNAAYESITTGKPVKVDATLDI